MCSQINRSDIIHYHSRSCNKQLAERNLVYWSHCTMPSLLWRALLLRPLHDFRSYSRLSLGSRASCIHERRSICTFSRLLSNYIFAGSSPNTAHRTASWHSRYYSSATVAGVHTINTRRIWGDTVRWMREYTVHIRQKKKKIFADTLNRNFKRKNLLKYYNIIKYHYYYFVFLHANDLVLL